MPSLTLRPLRSVFLLCLLPATIFAYSTGGYGGNSLIGGGGGGGGFSSGGGGGGYGGGEKGPITAAVETHRSVEVKPVQMASEPHEPQVIEVPSEDMPVIVHFKSQSSRVLVQQTHTPAQISEPEHTSSEDEPQRVVHESIKPVIQEIREIIQPYRRLIQQIQPVIEQTHTVIAKGEPRPPVQPISVPGASGGSLGGSSAGGAGGLSGGSGGGLKSFSSGGSGGGSYAAAASSISLKSAPSSSSSEGYRSMSSNHASSEGYRSMPSSHASSSSAPSNPNSGRKQQLSIQQIFQQASPAQSTYSSRRGDFREPAQPTQTKITLRPAPMGYNAYQRPVVSMPMYDFSDYKGAVSALHDEDLPLLTFVAKPIRFRARARA